MRKMKIYAVITVLWLATFIEGTFRDSAYRSDLTRATQAVRFPPTTMHVVHYQIRQTVMFLLMSTVPAYLPQ